MIVIVLKQLLKHFRQALRVCWLHFQFTLLLF